MCAEQAQEFALLGGEFLRGLAVLHLGFEFGADALCIGFVATGVAENLLLGVEGVVLTDVVEGAFAVLLALHATENGVDAEGEFFHREGLGEVVVGTDAEAFENVFFQGFGREEDDGHFGVGQTDFLCQGEAILFWASSRQRHRDCICCGEIRGSLLRRRCRARRRSLWPRDIRGGACRDSRRPRRGGFLLFRQES